MVISVTETESSSERAACQNDFCVQGHCWSESTVFVLQGLH